MDTTASQLILVDAHQDLAYNVLAHGRDYRRSALETRALESRSAIPRASGRCTIGLPELLEGNVAIVFGTVATTPARGLPSPFEYVYHSADQAHSQAMSQLDVYRRWADEESEMALIGSLADLEMVLATWQTGSAQDGLDNRQVGILPLMENAEPIREPVELELWKERGIRIVGPAWMSNRYTAGTGEPGPLTDLGRELLDVMAEFGVGLDLSHMAERAALEALERFEGVILASHSNPQAIVPGDRQLSEALIEGIAQRDGVIGIVLFNRFLRKDWRKGDRKQKVTLTNVVRAIDHVCQRIGDAKHVALGSDFDGGFGSESVPAEIDTVADLPKIATALKEHGFEDGHVAAVMGGNWLDLVRRLLSE